LCVIVVIVWSATSAALLSLQRHDGFKPRWRVSVSPILTKPSEPPRCRHPKIGNDGVKLFPPGHVCIEPIFRQRGTREPQNVRLAPQTQATMPTRRRPLIDQSQAGMRIGLDILDAKPPPRGSRCARCLF